MSLPDRSSFPVEFVAVLERHDREKAQDYRRRPILPAAETPQQLVDAAQNLDRLLGVHRATHPRVTELLEGFLRPHIDRALRREVTEPVDEIRTPTAVWDGELNELRELSDSYVYFVSLAEGEDRDTQRHVKFFESHMIRSRKHFAEQYGVELELTDEEWFAL